MEVGDVFAGTYRIEREVARGGMGVVYGAVDLGLDRPVALKVMSQSLSTDATYRARFRREAALAARIDHPHVVPVFHRGEHEGVMYVVMRLVEGVDLAQVLDREGRLAVDRTVALVGQVAGALDAAHRLDLVHRDVKPANILLQAGDRAMLTDFGLAKQASGAEALTSANTLLGTAGYLAPEQARGLPLDGRCDVYALACVAFHCLSGRTPYPDGAPLTVAAAHVYDPVPDLAAVAPDVPRAVVDVVARGLAKQPDDRWPTAGAMADALVAALAGATLETTRRAIAEPAALTRPLPPVPPAPRRRRRWPWVAVGSLALAGAAATTLALLGQGTSPTPHPTVTERHAALIARLPATIYRSCHPAPARERNGVVTAVDCTATRPGADELLVSLWQGPATMAVDWSEHYQRRLPDGTCRTDSEVRSTWEQGHLACYSNSARATVLLYEYDKRGLQVLAVRSDGNRVALYDWWHDPRLTPVG